MPRSSAACLKPRTKSGGIRNCSGTKSDGPRHADAVALGEADATWPQIVNDAARGQLKDVYEPVDAFGQESKPSLKEYPVIPWQSIDLKQFNLVPKALTKTLGKIGEGWGSFRIVPVESGRGCPYGCEFCTVTGFFGDSIRFRTNESVVNELLLLKARAREEKGQIAVFFIDDNFAINIKRTKSLLRDIIAAKAQVHWVAQISANLLRDEELVDLIAASGGKWIFIGMESIDPANLKDVNKGFNKPGEYAAVLERLASATCTRLLRLSLAWTTTLPALLNERWSRCAPGRRACPSLGCSRHCLPLLFISG